MADNDAWGAELEFLFCSVLDFDVDGPIDVAGTADEFVEIVVAAAVEIIEAASMGESTLETATAAGLVAVATLDDIASFDVIGELLEMTVAVGFVLDGTATELELDFAGFDGKTLLRHERPATCFADVRLR